MKRGRQSTSDRLKSTLYSGFEDVLGHINDANVFSFAGGKRSFMRDASNKFDSSWYPDVSDSSQLNHNDTSPPTESAISRPEEDANLLTAVLGTTLYDLARDIQKRSSSYDAFEVLYHAVEAVKLQENAIRAVKRRRSFADRTGGIYYQLLNRRLGRGFLEYSLTSQQLRHASLNFSRAINVWGHQSLLDDFDPGKPYNEPPQVGCILFDRTGDVIITGGDEGIIKLWHTHNCTLITSLRKHAGGVVSIDVHPNNHFILSCCDGGEMWLWEINGNLHRPHKRISIPSKYLWCRFVSTGGYHGTCPSGFSERCRQEIENTLVVCISADSKISIYRMSDMVMPSSGTNIFSDVVPMYRVDLYNHNIKAYDVSRPLMHDNSSLIAVGIELSYLEELRTGDDNVASALMILNKNSVTRQSNKDPGKYEKMTSNAHCALFNVSNGRLMTKGDMIGLADGVSKQGSDDTSHDNMSNNGLIDADAFVLQYCTCDANLSLTTDFTNTCRYCCKRVRSLRTPIARQHSYDADLFDGDSGDILFDEIETGTTSRHRNDTPNFLWEENTNDLEALIYESLESFTFTDDESDVGQMHNFGDNNMPIGRNSSTLIILPTVEPTPGLQDNNIHDPGDFEDLIYHIEHGHEMSPDVCFANTSLNHVTGSDDGTVYLRIHCNQRTLFQSTRLFTKCITRWLSDTDTTQYNSEECTHVVDPAFIYIPAEETCESGCFSDSVQPSSTIQVYPHDTVMKIDELNTSPNRSTPYSGTPEKPLFPRNVDKLELDVTDKSNTVVPNSSKSMTPYISFPTSYSSSTDDSLGQSAAKKLRSRCIPSSIDAVDDFTASDVIKPHMSDAIKDVHHITSKSSTKKEGRTKQSLSDSGHHYMITGIVWSLNDRYIHIADSIVTRFNVKKLITTSRTILSGVSSFNADGSKVADFLHNEISHHIVCLKPHPVTDDLLLTMTYGGVIYLLSIESKSIIKKLDCGPSAVWVDAAWHPSGLYFAASQSYGCFSLFTLDNLTCNYSSTLNHQSGYSDMLPINTTAFYTGGEENNQFIRRYYHGSTSMPPLELQGKNCSESLRIYTASSVHTVLDEHRCEVVYQCSPVAMEVKDCEPNLNHLSEYVNMSSTEWHMVSVLSRLPVDVSIIEFLQWHYSIHVDCDIKELINWYLRIQGLEFLLDSSNRMKSATCPYGGISCMMCHYMSTFTDRAARYVGSLSENRGIKSMTNNRGDIISCIPISARPSTGLTSSTTATTSVERRGITVSPNRRGTIASPTPRDQINTRSNAVTNTHQNSRTSLRLSISGRTQPTRVQPPRGRQQLLNVSPSQSDGLTEDFDVRSPRSTPSRISEDNASDHGSSTLSSRSDTTVISSVASPVLSSVRDNNIPSNAPFCLDNTTETSGLDGTYGPLLLPDSSSSDESSPCVVAGSYSLRKRRSSSFIEQAKRISEIIGPISLYDGQDRAYRGYGSTCVFCGLGADLTRGERSVANPVFIGGCEMIKNRLVGPFVLSDHSCSILRDELPTIYERLGKHIFMHTGCLVSTDGFVIDSPWRKIENLPWLLACTLHVKCDYCDEAFASLQCSRNDCIRAYHYPCSIQALYDEVYHAKLAISDELQNIYDTIENFPDPMLSAPFYCIECILKRCSKLNSGLRQFCTGDIFLKPDTRLWLSDDVRIELPCYYNPQGGEVVLLLHRDSGNLKANDATFWNIIKESKVLEIMNIDFQFYGPLLGEYGVCSVLTLRYVDNLKKVLSLFHKPGSSIILPLIDLFVSLWRVSKYQVGQNVKVFHDGTWKDGRIKEIKLGEFQDSSVVPDDLTRDDMCSIACSAMEMGKDSITVENVASIDNHTFSSWEVLMPSVEEKTLISQMCNSLFPQEFMEQLLNLTLYPEFEPFNSIPAYTENSEEWIQDYWKTIPNPMTLDRVRARILNSYYISPHACICDIELIIRNCRLLSRTNSEIFRLANKLERTLSPIKTEVRKSLSFENYVRTVISAVWPAVKPLFSREGLTGEPVGLNTESESSNPSALTDIDSQGITQVSGECERSTSSHERVGIDIRALGASARINVNASLSGHFDLLSFMNNVELPASSGDDVTTRSSKLVADASGSRGRPKRTHDGLDVKHNLHGIRRVSARLAALYQLNGRRTARENHEGVAVKHRRRDSLRYNFRNC
ncbi:Bromodomain family protein [Babesia bovis T2Bo]|uniref:Bromo domain-containing protein n=1 Tax=Babesia bovis TaxID=5865 RepID=A7AQE2_BABBO|nr:Bromodomain family protein [Babesia bovis T2Bo]EDO06761.1 Bromodomain family protein [Babesia bovis T2Bo]|eukprot:XP_001610329.1 hypothetical protein [Babesia bovis T2Bo]